MAVTDGRAELFGIRFVGNESTGSAAATVIDVSGTGLLQVQNSVFHDNIATTPATSPLVALGALTDGSLRFVTMKDNTAGGLKVAVGASGQLFGSMIWSNTWGVTNSSGGFATGSNDTQGGSLPGSGNISVAPTWNGALLLDASSAGSNAVVGDGTTSFNVVVRTGWTDMGALLH
jgi:hypothetical protein